MLFCSWDVYIFSWLFGHAEKRLDKKAKVSFKIMTLQTRQKIVTIHILFYISRSIGKKKRKFSQLIEYNMKNIFLEKLYDCGLSNSFSACFLKKNIFHVIFINWSKFIEWLLLLLELLGNMCMAIICCPVRDVINIEINLSFLVKAYFYITKK